MANRIIGLKNIHIAPIVEDGTYGKPLPLVGAKTLKTKNNFTEAQFFSDDVMDFYSSMLSSLDLEIDLAYLNADIEGMITGKKYDETTGALISSSNDKSGRFALLYEITTLQEPIRRVIYDTTLNKGESDAESKTDKVKEQAVKLTGVAKPNEQGYFDLILDKNMSSVNDTVWNSFFDEVLTVEKLEQLKKTIQSNTTNPSTKPQE